MAPVGQAKSIPLNLFRKSHKNSREKHSFLAAFDFQNWCRFLRTIACWDFNHPSVIATLFLARLLSFAIAFFLARATARIS